MSSCENSFVRRLRRQRRSHDPEEGIQMEEGAAAAANAPAAPAPAPAPAAATAAAAAPAAAANAPAAPAAPAAAAAAAKTHPFFLKNIVRATLEIKSGLRTFSASFRKFWAWFFGDASPHVIATFWFGFATVIIVFLVFLKEMGAMKIGS